jgi:hypothetical protein
MAIACRKNVSGFAPVLRAPAATRAARIALFPRLRGLPTTIMTCFGIRQAPFVEG